MKTHLRQLAAAACFAFSELRLIVPDARSKAVRRRIAKEVASLDRSRELDALGWLGRLARGTCVGRGLPAYE
jgi:hypothetical protein